MTKKTITLTEDQEKGVYEGIAYIKGEKYKDKKFIAISGLGGSGKSTITKFVIDYFKNKKVLGLAISHAAVGVLESFLGRECVTIAKGLDKKSVLNKKTGKKEFKIKAPLFPKLISQYDILIIDECSQIAEKTLAEILQYANMISETKIIFLGDVAQLPAVEGNNKISSTFDNTIVELKKAMRFKEPLTRINLNLRNHILGNIYEGLPLNRDVLRFEDDIRGLYNVTSKEALIKRYIAQYDPDNIQGNRITSYRIKTIDYYNNEIRKKLLGNNTEQIIKGDLIVANAPYNGGAIKNNDFLKVIKVTKARIDGLLCFMVDLKDSQGGIHYGVKIVDKTDYTTYYNQANYFKKKKQWVKYYEFTESFLNFSFSHAVNTHKMQGSTVNNIYVDSVDILSVGPTSELEKFQSLYVGESRASDTITVY